MRGMTTVEWLVIAAIVLLASRYLIGYWNSVWNPTREKAEELGAEFNESLSRLSAFSQQRGPRVLWRDATLYSPQGVHQQHHGVSPPETSQAF